MKFKAAEKRQQAERRAAKVQAAMAASAAGTPDGEGASGDSSGVGNVAGAAGGEKKKKKKKTKKTGVAVTAQGASAQQVCMTTPVSRDSLESHSCLSILKTGNLAYI
jgi:hypothetical protein